MNPIASGRAKLALITMAIALGGLWCVGCEDKGVSADPVLKNPPATHPVAQSPAPAATQKTTEGAAEQGLIPWRVPPGWERVPGERPMRVATFRRGVANEEIVVSQFPGDVGGVLANVNRWRGQVGLAPITEADLPKELRPFDNGKLKGHTMRLRGEKQHMLAAIISDPAADRTWFVKAITMPIAADTLEINLYAFAGSFGTGKFPDEWNMGAPQPATQPK